MNPSALGAVPRSGEPVADRVPHRLSPALRADFREDAIRVRLDGRLAQNEQRESPSGQPDLWLRRHRDEDDDGDHSQPRRDELPVLTPEAAQGFRLRRLHPVDEVIRNRHATSVEFSAGLGRQPRGWSFRRRRLNPRV